MTLKPRLTLSDDYAQDVKCAICGNSSLSVVHLDRFPDYVSCGQCASAFVVELDGSRVMYGNIASDYPYTSRFALREWATLEAVRSFASQEHPITEADTPPGEPPSTLQQETEEMPETPEEALPESLPLPTEPAYQEPSPTPITVATDPSVPQEMPAEPEAADPVVPQEMPPEPKVTEPVLLQETPAEPETVAVDQQATEPPKEGPPAAPEEEQVETPPGPSPDQRFCVAVKGDQINFPQGICAHCLSSPVRGVFEVPGRLPGEDPAAESQETTFQIPLCPDCGKLASTSSSGRKDSLIVAHLISLVAALLLIVGSILLGWVDFSSDFTRGILVLGGLALVGYLLPLALLLPRARRHPPYQEIALVRSTLHISQDPGNRQATIFAWRNQGYAHQFLEANQDTALGEVTSA